MNAEQSQLKGVVKLSIFFFSQFEDERIMNIFLVEYFVSINYF